MTFLFETLDVCGKTFTVIPGYSVIFISLFLALAFAMIARGIDKYWPLGPAIFLFLMGTFFIFYKDYLSSKVSDTLLVESQCIDAAFAVQNDFFGVSLLYLPSKIPNDSILQYQGNNERVLGELAKRYEFGINGVEMNKEKANEIKARIKNKNKGAKQ